MVSQGLDENQVKRVWQPFFDWVKNSKDLKASDFVAVAGQARHWWDVVYRKSKGSDALISDPRPGAPPKHAWWSGDRAQVGAFLHGYESLWLPATLLQKDQQQRLADALFAATRHKKVEMHFNKGIAGAAPAAVAATKDTATNPAVVDAFTLVIIADGERPVSRHARRQCPRPRPAGTNRKLILPRQSCSRLLGRGFLCFTGATTVLPESVLGTNYSKLRYQSKYDPDGLAHVATVSAVSWRRLCG
jgi:hypothetical protein